jgi:GGDEF domain-containing protein/CHASE3 domain sensor protein
MLERMATKAQAAAEKSTHAPNGGNPADDKPLAFSEKKGLDRLFRFIITYFLRLNIARKLMLGYSSLLALLVLISVYALINLNKLNDINASILKTDLTVIDASEKMIDVLLAQELYARRYLILGTADVLKLFWDKTNEFELLVAQVQSVPEKRNFPIKNIAEMHHKYSTLLFQGLEKPRGSEPALSADFDNLVKKHQESIIALIKEMSAAAIKDQNEKTEMTATIGRIAFKASAVLCGLGLIFSLGAAMLITRNISGAIKKLKYATGEIAMGKFDHKPDIRNRDELGDLAQAFVIMADRLKRLEEMYLDTSPLTRLPGGIAIENVVNKRIASNTPMAFCLMDIDNFKAYNDRYGYAKGNEIIRATAAIISKAVREFSEEDDFIGHIGGDDFVVLTTPNRYGKICESVIAQFDRTIPDFYDPEDSARGYILGENRQGTEVSFPLASISIAVVTNERRKFHNHIQFGEVAAEMKEHAKSIAGSIFMVDQRSDDPQGTKRDRKLIRMLER